VEGGKGARREWRVVGRLISAYATLQAPLLGPVEKWVLEILGQLMALGRYVRRRGWVPRQFLRAAPPRS
jgi:hypothetical protein